MVKRERDKSLQMKMKLSKVNFRVTGQSRDAATKSFNDQRIPRLRLEPVVRT